MNQYEKELDAFLCEKDRETRFLFRQMRGAAARTIFDKDWFSGGQVNHRLYCEPKLVLKSTEGDYGDMDEDDLRNHLIDVPDVVVDRAVASAAVSKVRRKEGKDAHEAAEQEGEHIEEHYVSGIYSLEANPFSDLEYQRTTDKGLLLFLGRVDYLRFDGESIVVGERKISRPPNDPAWASDVAQALSYCWSLQDFFAGSAYAAIPLSIEIEYMKYQRFCRFPVVNDRTMGDFEFTLGWWKMLTPYQVMAREMSRLYRILTGQSTPIPPASRNKCDGRDGSSSVPCEYRDTCLYQP